MRRSVPGTLTMNKIILAIFGVLFLCGVVLKILFALLFPKRFADGARQVLFIEERQKRLFGNAAGKSEDLQTDEETDTSH